MFSRCYFNNYTVPRLEGTKRCKEAAHGMYVTTVAKHLKNAVHNFCSKNYSYCPECSFYPSLLQTGPSVARSYCNTLKTPINGSKVFLIPG